MLQAESKSDYHISLKQHRSQDERMSHKKHKHKARLKAIKCVFSSRDKEETEEKHLMEQEGILSFLGHPLAQKAKTDT